jgi:hypothetical protein
MRAQRVPPPVLESGEEGPGVSISAMPADRGRKVRLRIGFGVCQPPASRPPNGRPVPAA